MIKYNVYYRERCIGELHINEAGQHKYVADAAAIQEVETVENVHIFSSAKNSRDWGEPIAFFDSRIKNCERFGQTDIVKYPNSDYYFMKEIQNTQ